MRPARRKSVVIALVCILIIVIILWARWRPANRFEFKPVAQNQIRVMTWNVGYFAVARNKNLRDVDAEPIVALIAETDSDFVVLQELSNTDQAKVIAEALGNRWSDYSAETGHGNQTLSVLSKYSNLDSIDDGLKIATLLTRPVSDPLRSAFAWRKTSEPEVPLQATRLRIPTAIAERTGRSMIELLLLWADLYRR